jgi:hypothetical protein
MLTDDVSNIINVATPIQDMQKGDNERLNTCLISLQELDHFQE